jgi:hypothetical protein
VTLTVPGKGPPGGAVGAKGTPGPNYKKLKDDAAADFRRAATQDAVRFCLPYAGGLLTFGAGVLVLGAGPTIGASLAVTGSLTASATLPFCNAVLIRMGKDLKTFRDPPLRSVHVLAVPRGAHAAALPSCARRHGVVKRYCARLRNAYTRLDLAAARLAADATAIEETISRETAAVNAGSQGAANEQDAHLGALFATEQADRGGEARAGKAVAAALRSGGVRLRLSKRQSAKLIAATLEQAAKHGVTRGDFSSLAPRALKPAATDLRADFGRL